jgi:hypothetical protein
MKTNITEDMHIHEQWYEEAKKQTLTTLPEFCRSLSEDYHHDYGTICHAITAAGIATMWAMNHTEQGGITGFQASCIMWEFIKNWMGKEGHSLRLLDYSECGDNTSPAKMEIQNLKSQISILKAQLEDAKGRLASSSNYISWLESQDKREMPYNV